MNGPRTHLRILAAFSALLLGALSAGTSALAADQGERNNYRVEVIIFRTAQAPPGSEDLGAPAEGRGFNGRIDTTNPPSVVRLLEPTELQMTPLAEKMRANAGYQVLAHAGWLQTATLWPRHSGLSLDQFGINVPDLHGTLYLERGDLLHFGAQLQLGTNPVYSLSELRRVRFNERHYLDHPAFGVIVQVSPVR
jgi:hypothetical protein